ncbi:MAG: DMT family transporter [Cyclobacteriaceae bacterium]|nr:DMT family transporter [Cyclobacteriaceae bacterium HetDA_MAG_MS6]
MPVRVVGIAFAVLGILLFSTKAVFVKLAYQYGVDSISLLLIRMTMALPFYLAIIAIQHRQQEPLTRNDYLFLILFGFMGYYLASYFDFLGLQYIKASVERLILFVYPTLVLVLSFLFLKKKISQRQLMAFALTYIGILIVFVPEVQDGGGENVLLGGALIFLSALTYAGYIVGSGWLIPRFGATRFTSLAMLVSCTMVILHFTLQKQGFEEVVALPNPVYLYGFLMATVSTVIPSYLVSFAIKRLGARDFAIFGSLGPISTSVLAYFFLQEQLTALQVVGALVVIAGIYISEQRRK